MFKYIGHLIQMHVLRDCTVYIISNKTSIVNMTA